MMDTSELTYHVIVMNICFVPLYYSVVLYFKWLVNDNEERINYLPQIAKLNILSWVLIHFSTVFEIMFLELLESVHPINKMLLPVLTFWTFFICAFWYYLMIVAFRYRAIADNL